MYLRLKVLRKPKHINTWTAAPRWNQRRNSTVPFSCVFENFSGFQSQELARRSYNIFTKYKFQTLPKSMLQTYIKKDNKAISNP